jgi:hypothetical protein
MAKCTHDNMEYAIKFFVSRAAFDVELALYDRSGDSKECSLAQFLPKVGILSSCLGGVLL